MSKLQGFVKLTSVCQSYKGLSNLQGFVKLTRFCQTYKGMSNLDGYLKDLLLHVAISQFCFQWIVQILRVIDPHFMASQNEYNSIDQEVYPNGNEVPKYFSHFRGEKATITLTETRFQTDTFLRKSFGQAGH